MFRCDECGGKLVKVKDAPANSNDWQGSTGSQGYTVFQCEHCKNVEGCRFQYDAGTGADDRWHNFGVVDPMTVERHY